MCYIIRHASVQTIYNIYVHVILFDDVFVFCKVRKYVVYSIVYDELFWDCVHAYPTGRPTQIPTNFPACVLTKRGHVNITYCFA